MTSPYNSTDNPNPNGKHPGGRPPKWTDPEALQKAVDQYFVECDNHIIKKQHVTGKGIIIVETPEPYTMAGLADALDVDRITLLNYSHDDQFFSIIAHARRKIERQNITHGALGCHDSRIAALNLAANYGYATKQDMDIQTGGEKINTSDTEIARALAFLLRKGIETDKKTEQLNEPS